MTGIKTEGGDSALDARGRSLQMCAIQLSV